MILFTSFLVVLGLTGPGQIFFIVSAKVLEAVSKCIIVNAPKC